MSETMTIGQSHELKVEYFKSGTGFRAHCPCGQFRHRATGCNRGGMAYALVAARERYDAHLKKVAAPEVPHA